MENTRNIVKNTVKSSTTLLVLGLSTNTPYIEEFCREDQELAETIRRLYAISKQLANTCIKTPTSLEQLVKNMIQELKACKTMECVKAVISEYEPQLLL